MDARQISAISKNYALAELVVVGQLASLGSSPGLWSGIVPSYQEAVYEKLRYLKGAPRITQVRLIVLHPIVSRSMTAAEGAPILRSSIFRCGATLVLFLRERAGRLITFDENYG